MYLASKVIVRDDLKKLEEIKTLDNPVVVLMKTQFNYLLRNELYSKYNDVDYIILKPGIAYIFIERLCFNMAKILKFINVITYYKKIVLNVLPNLQINKVIYRENPAKTLFKINKYFKKTL